MSRRPEYLNNPPGGGRPPLQHSRSDQGSPSSSGLPSPRMQHMAGDLTPALSPLDMFAMQSRAMARQLDESRKTDNRISRLPPLTVSENLARKPGHRPGMVGTPPAEEQHHQFNYQQHQHQQQHQPYHQHQQQQHHHHQQQHHQQYQHQNQHQQYPDVQTPVSGEDGPSGRLEIENPTYRPQSHYPRFSRASSAMSDATEDGGPNFPRFGRDSAMSDLDPRYSRQSAYSDAPDDLQRQESIIEEDEVYETPMETAQAPDYTAAMRARSPEYPPRRSMESLSQKSSQASSKPKSSLDSSRRTDLVRGLSIESSSSRVSHYSKSLQPPNPPFARKSPSIRSVSSEDDVSGATQSSTQSHDRGFSSSGTSLPLSPPFSQQRAPHNRSPSQMSDFSTTGTRASRHPFNFSRPMSRSSRPSVDSPTRMSSLDSQPRSLYDDESNPRISIENSHHRYHAEPDMMHEEEPAQSYIYSKFVLPRGRMLGQRDPLDSGAMTPRFDWERTDQPSSPFVEPERPSTADPHAMPGSSMPLLPTPPDSIGSGPLARGSTESLPARPPPVPATQPVANPTALAHELGQRRSLTSMVTQDSASTIKASRHNRRPSSAELTAEQHVDKGIACHELGSLNESTYHFRLAARQNHPTGMLMYALACRHGWGMRKSPGEGIMWLRKAMDCASIELSTGNDDGGTGIPGIPGMPPPRDGGQRGAPGAGAAGASGAAKDRQAEAEGRRTRKAQFALSVYELGVSHMNGWGIEQDKSLALRCFEIAASWGDADAMAEAGFCYAQGVGCKKDLKKAARYYREAEARGMSMVGNSWIYKSKYNEEGADERGGRSAHKQDDKKDKKREKSRTRTLFGRKKSEKIDKT